MTGSFLGKPGAVVFPLQILWFPPPVGIWKTLSPSECLSAMTRGFLDSVAAGDPENGAGRNAVHASCRPWEKKMDAKLASGEWRPTPAIFPMVLGVDGAGIVETVGDRTTRFRPGDQVFGQLFVPPIGASGTYAEYVAVTAEAPLALIPDGVDPLDDQVVLIVGAGGGVGTFAAQFAVNAGARVIANIDALAESRMRSSGVTETVVRPQVPATKDTARFGTVRQTPENVSSPVIAPRSGGLSQRHGSRSSTVLPSLLPPSPPGYSNTEREPETSWCVGLTGTRTG